MDPELKKLLEDTHKLAEDSNRMLHKIRSVQKWGALWSSFKLLIVIGITLGSFYFLEPYLGKLTDMFNSISGANQQFQNFFKNSGN